MNSIIYIEKNKYLDLRNKFNYKEDGDFFEKKYGHILNGYFPNHEVFWKKYITLLTNRFSDKCNIRKRKNISDRIKKIADYHYTVFLNLLYSFNYIENNGLSSFEDFYFHLASSIDLSEDFLLDVCLLKLKYIDNKDPYSTSIISYEVFMQKAEDYYRDNFQKDYEHYISKGKWKGINFNIIKDPLIDYLKNNNWKKYYSFAQEVRTYRNRLVHNIPIPKLLQELKNHKIINLVLTKEAIQKRIYPDLESVVEIAVNDFEKQKANLIEYKELMHDDFEKILKFYDKLWEKPITDFEILFANKDFLSNEYAVSFTESNSQLKEDYKKPELPHSFPRSASTTISEKICEPYTEPSGVGFIPHDSSSSEYISKNK